jgi:hypothetical protein
MLRWLSSRRSARRGGTDTRCTRILLLDLLRRVAILSLLSVAGIGLLAPLTARSGVAEAHDDARLLRGLSQSGKLLDRGSVPGRERSATLTLADAGRSIGPELLLGRKRLSRPKMPVMEATLVLGPAATPAPTPQAVTVVAPPPSGDIVRGAATWYCCSVGYRGQAVVALPGALGGQYDPPPADRFVTVCADRCARLPVVDYCGCLWGTPSQRVADLAPEAWAAVSDRSLGSGVITVTIHLDG